MVGRTVVLLMVFSAASVAQQQRSTAVSSEARASRALDAAKKAGSSELYALLRPFPKGADLHMHLDGAVYAETFLAEAAEQGLCVDPIALSFDMPAANPGQGSRRETSGAKAGQATPQESCAAGHVPASETLRNETLYDKLIDSFSMRGFAPSEGFTGHDQFFATFGRFSGLGRQYKGAWLHEVASRAAAQNEQYLEIMTTPSDAHALAAGNRLGWPAEFSDANHMAVLAKLREALLAGGLRDDIAIDSKELADAQASRRELEPCGGSDELPPGNEHAACTVRIHFLYQVLRGFAPEQVFAQTLLAFEVASTDPDVVGINFVRAEDWRGPMAQYHTEMLMLDYLHSVYPKVRISLHAGELAPGLVPPEGLRFHIREAVQLGYAERIGHGVDVLYEDHPAELLREMAQRHIMVEINLTSNDVILGIRGTDHALAAYRSAHVPWALSTDDEGVSRTDLTHEYVRAVRDQNLDYTELKQSARTSLEHAFLGGPSLWTAEDLFTHRVGPCAAPINANSTPGASCQTFLNTSERAAAQWELERRLAVFEAGVH